MILLFQFFYVLTGKEGEARKLFLLSQLSWINQDSGICGCQHFVHPAEKILKKSVFLGAPMYMVGQACLYIVQSFIHTIRNETAFICTNSLNYFSWTNWSKNWVTRTYFCWVLKPCIIYNVGNLTWCITPVVLQLAGQHIASSNFSHNSNVYLAKVYGISKPEKMTPWQH